MKLTMKISRMGKTSLLDIKTQSLILCVLTVLLITLSAAGCKKEDDKKTVSEGPIFAVNTIAAVKGQIQDYITFSGDIVAGSTVDVLPEAAGRVAEVFVTVGRRVNRGDRIASVDPSRPGMTFRHNIATAPISGTIVAVPAQVGMTVSQAVPLARIAGGGALEIRLHVAERFISRMSLNLPCEITLDAWPGEIFRGSISELSPTVDLASRTMEVRVNVRDSGSKLKPGMFAQVRIVTEHKDNIVKIPASAVVSRFGEQYVYVIEAVESETEETDQTAEENGEEQTKRISYVVRKRTVTPGILIDGVVEITSGLSPDEEIVVKGQTLLDDGSRVNIIERVTPLRERL